jgi:hypothetical protein
MHIAEDEEALLRQKIHALVGAPPDTRHFTSDGSSSDNVYSDMKGEGVGGGGASRFIGNAACMSSTSG